MTRITRRAFLKTAAVCGLSLPAGQRLRAARQLLVAVPPSIMLHARQDHLDNLGALIDWLLDKGLTPITYRALWDGLTNAAPLPSNPVIISIDDLTLVKGSSNFVFIEKMVHVLIDKKVPGVLALNTEPVIAGADGQPVSLRDQDDTLWATAAGWADEGIELATHTHSHQNLADGSLRPEDYEREVGGSAGLIEERTGQAVTTLVLPFGNGIGPDGALLPPIIEACHAAGIGMVVGVAGGRVPLVPAAAQTVPIYFVGRVGPMRDNFSTIYGDVEYWLAENAVYQVGSDLP